MVGEVLPDAHGRFHDEAVPTWFAELRGFLAEYFSNVPRPAELGAFVDVWATWKPRLDFAGMSAFQRQVLDLVARIPRGQVRTYGQVAEQLGHPRAARAVGAAMRCNPWPVLVPCHRVVGAGGALTGFSGPGGVGAKRRMLAWESADGP